MRSACLTIMRASRGADRRGATIVLVLGLLAVTLAVSYAMMRTQATSLQIQTNQERRGDARQAALTGMAVALRRIHDADWAGVDTPVSGTLADGSIYEVEFATGDDALQAGDEDFDEYPFRLTLTSTGYAIDSSDSGRRSEYRVEAVVQLVRRAFAAEPAAWTNLNSFTLVQWADQKTNIEIPARIEGPVKLGGTLELCADYPDDTPRARYLGDLEKMREDGRGDYRPFNGPITLPFDQSSSATLSLLTDKLDLTLQNGARGGSAPLSHPGTVSTYRIYPGGKEYEIPVIQSEHGYELSNITIEADPLTNPLAVFRSDGYLRLDDNVSIQGAVITTGYEPYIDVSGQNVTWSAPALPPLEDQSPSATVHLSTALVANDFSLDSGASLTLQGAVVVWGELDVEKGVSSTLLSLQGRLFTNQLSFYGYNAWDDVNWSNAYNDFVGLLGLSELLGGLLGIDRYFPGFMQSNYGLRVAPKINLKAGSATATYHWQDWSQPVYAPQAGDEGLIWDLLRWSESP